MINCIAIDDEPLALRQIVKYIQKTPFLNLLQQFNTALDAITFLQEEEVDLMFVDINMPDLTGMEFVKSLSNPPGVIFTTAYSEYAFEGFKVDAIDYLLKPIGYTDFLKAAEKAQSRLRAGSVTPSELKTNDDFLFIRSEYKLMRIELNDIYYIEGMREYLRIHLQGQKPIMTLMSIKKLEEFLPDDRFMRVHRSYIVNLNKITTVERNQILFDKDVSIPVSENYQAKFKNYLENNFLI